MPELEQLVYLIHETDKTLFNDSMVTAASTIFDGYNIKHGVKGIYEILGYFIEWIDTNKGSKSA